MDTKTGKIKWLLFCAILLVYVLRSSFERLRQLIKFRQFSSLKHQANRLEMFCRKGILRNFAKFTGKLLCQSLFLNNIGELRPATLLKKRLRRRCFLCIFRNFKNTFFYRTSPVAASENGCSRFVPLY